MKKKSSPSSFNIRRPIVRSFSETFSLEAATWVKQGGHAVVWQEHPSHSGKKRAKLVVPPPKRNDRSDLHLFSILDIGKKLYKIEKTGLFQGLASCLVQKSSEWIVKRRIERDSIFPAPTHLVSLDCLACGQCCKANWVFLEEEDKKRFLTSETSEDKKYLRAPYTFKDKETGKLRLKLIESEKRCIHLKKNNKCTIYTLRPDACRDFPAGSESCLYTREFDLNVFDGLPPQAI